jgi:hypothetical protein
VQNGVDLYAVKELLGHKTITMTMRYAHHYPESLRSGVEVLDRIGYSMATIDKKEELAMVANSSKVYEIKRKSMVAMGGANPRPLPCEGGSTNFCKWAFHLII